MGGSDWSGASGRGGYHARSRGASGATSEPYAFEYLEEEADWEADDGRIVFVSSYELGAEVSAEVAEQAARRLTPGRHRGKGPKGYRRPDARVHDEICERLTRDGDVDPSAVEVRVEGGVVTLSGSVTDRWTKREVERIAQDVLGVVDVHNRLAIAREGVGRSDSA